MRLRKRSTILLVLAALAALPLRGDGALVACCNSTTSLASTINAPVAGDEAFFKLPSGPASVMLILDTSGSMLQFPQCGDDQWGASGAATTCSSPTLSVTAISGSNTTGALYNVTGTCTPYTDGTGKGLKWMESVTPKTAYADAGQTSALLHDCPPWGNGGSGCATTCSGNKCLFDPAGYYIYNSSAVGWSTTSSSAAATRYEIDSGGSTTAAPYPACTALDASGTPLRDCAGNLISLGTACTTCMTNHGYYFYKVSYAPYSVTTSGGGGPGGGGPTGSGCTTSKSGSTTTYTVNSSYVTTVGPLPLWKGTFLNANPPKFVSARKVIKNLAWMTTSDTGDQLELDQVRLGLAVTDSSKTSPQKARLIVPLGPDKGHAYPYSQDNFRQARQYILSVLNYDASVYTTDAASLTSTKSNLLVDGTTLTGGYFNPANGSTPLASALFNVGQYFSSSSFYDSTFGTTGCSGKSCQVSSFVDTSSGEVKAAWATNTSNTQCSVCWACQNNAAIIITDGSPNSEITFPSAITSAGSTAYALTANCGRATCASCPSALSADTSACTTCSACTACGSYTCAATSPCNCYSPSETGTQSVLPRVAYWLDNTDIRADYTMSGAHMVKVHTIGFNVQSQMDPRAYNILAATANMGGGTVAIAGDETALASALYNAIETVVPKQNSLSAASTTSLQTVETTSTVAFLSRFTPNESFPWEGHLVEAYLFDEAANGCDASLTTQPKVTCGSNSSVTVSADFDGDGACTGTFLVDSDCDEIAEDSSTGVFIKKGTSTAANVPWDAGKVLSYPSQTGYRSANEKSTANARTIFTWVGGVRVDLTAANASVLLPYLNISSSWCSSLLTTLGLTVASSGQTLACAQAIIYFVRGWDVLDQDGDGCASPLQTNASTCQHGALGEERDRDQDGRTTPTFWKLGDIAHSAPAVLKAPLDEYSCDTGYENQCFFTIHSPSGLSSQTPMADSSRADGDAYEAYRQANLGRKRIVLVGANDGMLHAFDAGAADTSAGLDSLGAYSYKAGTGEELWAFVPPDLLPRLKELLSAHAYTQDGSVMLRDVWVDGSNASDASSGGSYSTVGWKSTAVGTKDGIKQAAEFHTVAIFGRRAGGNQYTALDVTDPAKPTFLWNFPPGCSDDARYMGESWAEFGSKAPPIAPVRLYSTNGKDSTRGFEERWIAMLSGGYDPTMTLGRAVFMVDAWTGTTLWRFTDDDWKATSTSSASPAAYGHSDGSSLFPVTAAVSLMDVGDTTTSSLDQDGFMDTATWGDLGGNLWLARFHEVGSYDSVSGRVGNWYVGRAFEQQRQTSDAQLIANRHEFFYLASNVFDSTTHTLRTFLGSGNREHLMDQAPACGTDELLGCCAAGCTSVIAKTTQSYSSCARTDTFTCSSGALTHAFTDTCAAAAATCATSSVNYAQAVDISFACPGAGTITDATGSASCDSSGLCTVSSVGSKTIDGTYKALTHNRFYGVWSYGRNAGKMFSTLAEAKAFDKNRSTDAAYSSVCSGVAGGTASACTLVNVTEAVVSSSGKVTCADGSAKCAATAYDPGWYYEYGTVCPLASCSDTPPWLDEKTASGGNVVLSCLSWSNIRPSSSTTSTDPCSGTLGAPEEYAYSANALTGVPTTTCGTAGASAISRATATSVAGAPSGGQTVVNGSGSTLTYKNQSITGAKASSTTAGTRSAAGTPVYWLEVPRTLHACRHTTSSTEKCH